MQTKKWLKWSISPQRGTQAHSHNVTVIQSKLIFPHFLKIIYYYIFLVQIAYHVQFIIDWSILNKGDNIQSTEAQIPWWKNGQSELKWRCPERENMQLIMKKSWHLWRNKYLCLFSTEKLYLKVYFTLDSGNPKIKLCFTDGQTNWI